MKETGTAHWESPNYEATNESGFSGLPGGFRDYDGSFYYVGSNGDWWSSTETSPSFAMYRELGNYSTGVYRNSTVFGLGFNVRCLRD